MVSSLAKPCLPKSKSTDSSLVKVCLCDSIKVCLVFVPRQLSIDSSFSVDAPCTRILGTQHGTGMSLLEEGSSLKILLVSDISNIFGSIIHIKPYWEAWSYNTDIYQVYCTFNIGIDIHESLYNSTKYNDRYQSLCLLLLGADPMRQKGNNVLQHGVQRLLSTPS